MFRVQSLPPSLTIEIISEGIFASAPLKPQRCGKEHVSLYNEAGLATWLRSKFPSATGYHVEAETGIPAASVENWIQRRSRPSVESFATLLSAFGPSLMMACLSRPARWVEKAVRAERMDQIDEEIAALAEERDRVAQDA